MSEMRVRLDAWRAAAARAMAAGAMGGPWTGRHRPWQQRRLFRERES